MFLISIKLNKCVKKLFQKIMQYCNLFLIAVVYYPYELQYVPDCETAVDTYSSTLIDVCNYYKTQKMYERGVDAWTFRLSS